MMRFYYILIFGVSALKFKFRKWFLNQIEYPAPTAGYSNCRIPRFPKSKIRKMAVYFKLKRLMLIQTEDYRCL